MLQHFTGRAVGEENPPSEKNFEQLQGSSLFLEEDRESDLH